MPTTTRMAEPPEVELKIQRLSKHQNVRGVIILNFNGFVIHSCFCSLFVGCKSIPLSTADAGSAVTKELCASADYVMANVHPKCYPRVTSLGGIQCSSARLLSSWASTRVSMNILKLCCPSGNANNILNNVIVTYPQHNNTPINPHQPLAPFHLPLLLPYS
ncbi:hypothetical protein PGTUg99_035398 [Puccinia graminis f. sp. tritici]|uniref:Uncharacterized protein n=1 Tax=Puccinia graminis f. sp. tritici TaxID=56615 RepID=A0A5B0RNS8_PUCGR|nr:hypothetical protein PGTUg99_035398 [Puccinia graminis f. sp. tritici]